MLLSIDILILFFFMLFLIVSERLHLRTNENTALVYMQDTKLSVAILLLCSCLALTPLPQFADILPTFVDNHHENLNRLKSLTYVFSSLPLMLLYGEQKSLLRIRKNKKSNPFDTYSPIAFISAGLGIITALSSCNFIVWFLGFETTSCSVFYLFYHGRMNNVEQPLTNDEQSLNRNNLAEPQARKADFFMLKISWLTSMFFAAVAIVILGLTGSFAFAAKNLPYQTYDNVLSHTAFILLICAFLIKIAAFPFHLWISKIFYTAKNSVCCLFACVTIPAWIYLAAHLFGSTAKDYMIHTEPVFIIIAFLNIIIAAITLNTPNLKHFIFATVSIGTGLCLFTFPELYFQNKEAILTLLLFFLMPQSLALAGIFSTINIISDRTKSGKASIVGIGKVFPALSFALLIFTLCLVGAPPFITFLSRISMISSLQSFQHTTAAVGIMISMVLMFIYIFDIIRLAYRDVKNEDTDNSNVKIGFVTLLCIALLITFSVFGEAIFNFCASTVMRSLS